MLRLISSVGFRIERLEERRMLATINVGALVGRAYFPNQSLTSATYNFSISQAEVVQAQVSNEGPAVPAVDLNVVLTGGPNNVSIKGTTVNLPALQLHTQIEQELPAGDYTL